MSDEAQGGYRLPGESEDDRTERRMSELMTEVRIIMPGVQVLFAFLLTVPFQARFDTVTDTEEALYLVTLLSAGLASACLIGSAATHRVLFGQGQREFVIRVGNRLVLVGLIALAVAMSCAAALVVSFVWTAAAAWLTLAGGAVLFGSLWFVLPLTRAAAARAATDAGQASPSASYSRRKPSNRRRWPSSSRRMAITMSFVTGSTPSVASTIWL